jgi:hypothetical protein
MVLRAFAFLSFGCGFGWFLPSREGQDTPALVGLYFLYSFLLVIN